MPSKLEIEKHFRKYDKRTTQAMTDLIQSGRSINRPVRTIKNASTKELRRRATFGQRKAIQILNQKQPLKDAKGLPTPAAMQFRRWAYKMPTTYADVRKILTDSRKVLRNTGV